MRQTRETIKAYRPVPWYLLRQRRRYLQLNRMRLRILPRRLSLFATDAVRKIARSMANEAALRGFLASPEKMD